MRRALARSAFSTWENGGEGLIRGHTAERRPEQTARGKAPTGLEALKEAAKSPPRDFRVLLL